MDFLLRDKAINYARRDPEVGEKPEVIRWIDRFSSKFFANPDDRAAREDLVQLCKLIIHRDKEWRNRQESEYSWRWKSRPFSDQVLGLVVAVAVDLNDKSMFLEALSEYTKEAPASEFRQVGTGLLRFEQESLLPRSVLKQIFKHVVANTS